MTTGRINQIADKREARGRSFRAPQSSRPTGKRTDGRADKRTDGRRKTVQSVPVLRSLFERRPAAGGRGPGKEREIKSLTVNIHFVNSFRLNERRSDR